LNIQTRDAKGCQSTRAELLEGGGKIKVPCLRIEANDGSVKWMYESSEIINYIETNISTQQA